MNLRFREGIHRIEGSDKARKKKAFKRVLLRMVNVLYIFALKY